jgi:hypothetical protein
MIGALHTFGDFVDAEDLHGGAAVYALLLGGRVVYIGATTKVFQRLAQHRRGTWSFDQVMIRWCPVGELAEAERLLIRHFTPIHNEVWNPARRPSMVVRIGERDFVLRPKTGLSRLERIMVARVAKRRAEERRQRKAIWRRF